MWIRCAKKERFVCGHILWPRACSASDDATSDESEADAINDPWVAPYTQPEEVYVEEKLCERDKRRGFGGGVLSHLIRGFNLRICGRSRSTQ